MSHTPTPPRPLAAWLRRHWLAVCAGTLIIGLLAANTPAWAAPVARPLNQTVPRPTPTSSSDPLATATPRAGDSGDSDDNDDDANTGGGGGGDSDSSAPATGPNIVFPNTDGDAGDADEASSAPASPAVGGGAAAAPALTARVTVGTLNLRQGPGVSFNALGALPANSQVTVNARNEDGSWWFICCLPNSQTAGWVSAQLLTPDFDRSQALTLIPLFGSEPTPAPAAAAAAAPADATRLPQAERPLQVEFQLDPPFLWQNITATLTITVSNPNTVDVIRAELSDELPAALRLIQAGADGGGTVEQVTTANRRPLLLFRWPTIPAGDSVAATIVFETAADLADGAVIDNLVGVRARNAAYGGGAVTIGMPPIAPPSFQ